MLVAQVSWPVVLQITASEAPERSPEAFSKAFQQGRGESSGSRPPKSCGQTSQRWHMLFYERLVKPCWGRRSSRAARSRSAAPGAAREACCRSHWSSLLLLLLHLSISQRSPWRPRCARRPPTTKVGSPLLDAQDRPKIAPRGSKIAPRSLQAAQDRPKNARRGAKIAPRCPKSGPRAAKRALGTILGSSCAILEPSWDQKCVFSLMFSITFCKSVFSPQHRFRRHLGTQ